MNAFSPDFAHFWMTCQTGKNDAIAGRGSDDDAPSPSQQEALDALADRINAARSVY
jgi:hypothetical protein